MPFAEGTPTESVTLGGRTYALGYTLGAMKRAKELGVLTVDMTDDTAFILSLPEYVWSCLDTEGRNDLSVDAIRELMNPLNAKAVAQSMIELFKKSLPKGEPDPNAKPAAVKEPTAGNQSTSINSGQLASATSG